MRFFPFFSFVVFFCGLGLQGLAQEQATTAIPVENPMAFSRETAWFWGGNGEAFIGAWNAGERALRWQKTETAGKVPVIHYSAYLSGMKIFGTGAEQIKLEECGGKLREIEIMFFNKGDTASRMGFGTKSTHSSGDKRDFTEALWKDCFERIRKSLSAFGKSRRGKIGSQKLRRSAEIWENGGNAFLLDAEENEFVRVFVVPQGELKQLTSAATERAKGNLRENVVRRSNGDVLVGEIPMIDQGGKGYCVPATIERVLRYYGINELDMHKIADLAGTNVGGGTRINELVRGLSPVVKKNRLKFATRRMQLSKIRQCVDKGVPIFWSMFAAPDYLNRLRANTRERASVQDFTVFAKKLKDAEPLEISKQELIQHAHLCLIIGYNLKTKEVCVSDSWGDHTAEQWIAFDDALYVTQKNAPLYILEK